MVDPQQFRDLMAGVCAPVTVVTATIDGVPYGATVSSFASLSLDPPLISVAFDRGSALLSRIQQSRRFGVNLLGQAQDDLAMVFARPSEDRFAGVDWHMNAGLPRLTHAAGWIECDLHQSVEGGDHLLLFGLVINSSHRALPPLVYAHRTFGTHSKYSERPRLPIADHIAALSW
jgi:flavin reductase (DIM6/NTAB) family NADH-FMN oxidoreductase RutF